MIGRTSSSIPFLVPTCGVVVTYILDLDKDKGSFEFREPENAKWAESEDGAVKTLTFSDEIVVPAGMPDFISPHIATWGRYDWKAYQKDESLRQMFARKGFHPRKTGKRPALQHREGRDS